MNNTQDMLGAWALENRSPEELALVIAHFEKALAGATEQKAADYRAQIARSKFLIAKLKDYAYD